MRRAKQTQAHHEYEANGRLPSAIPLSYNL